MSINIELDKAPLLYWYEVVSPEYSTGGSYDPPEPPEYGCDVLMVQAPTARAAKVAAVKHWRKDRRSYVGADYSVCPFTGLKTNKVPAEDALSESWDGFRVPYKETP